MTLPTGSIHLEVLFGAGYAILLVAAAFGLEWMARGAYRRSESYELNGFTYHRDLDVWECPTGQRLTPTAADHLQQIVQYRARPSACNSCPLKSQCTDSDEGRVIVRSQAPWPHSEIARFHRALSLLLLGMAGLALIVVALRHPTGLDLGALSGPAALVLGSARRLWPAFHATHAGFDWQ